MTQRTYPRQAWVLQPSFRPKEVTLVRRAFAYSPTDYGDTADTGKDYAPEDMFPTKADAIAEGKKRLDEQQAKLDKMQANLDKRRATLKKAEKQ